MEATPTPDAQPLTLVDAARIYDAAGARVTWRELADEFEQAATLAGGCRAFTLSLLATYAADIAHAARLETMA